MPSRSNGDWSRPTESRWRARSPPNVPDAQVQRGAEAGDLIFGYTSATPDMDAEIAAEYLALAAAEETP